MNIVKLHFHAAFLNTLYKLFLPGGKKYIQDLNKLLLFNLKCFMK